MSKAPIRLKPVPRKSRTNLNIALELASGEIEKLIQVAGERPLNAIETKQLETYHKMILAFRDFKARKLAKDIEELKLLSDDELKAYCKS